LEIAGLFPVLTADGPVGSVVAGGWRIAAIMLFLMLFVLSSICTDSS